MNRENRKMKQKKNKKKGIELKPQRDWRISMGFFGRHFCLREESPTNPIYCIWDLVAEFAQQSRSNAQK